MALTRTRFGLLASLFVVGLTCGATTPAAAIEPAAPAAPVSAPAAAAPGPMGTLETGDVVTDWQIEYRVTGDGVLQVTEKITYAFASFGRHGIYRDLVTREQFVGDRANSGQQDDKDQEYRVENIEVTSPDASAKFTTDSSWTGTDKRTKQLRIKIGDANRTVGRSARYEIQYTVRGALRHFDDRSELYWDATGAGWDARLAKVSVTAEVPGGATQVDCLSGRPGSTDKCDSATVQGGKAVFSQAGIPSGEQLTIVAGIRPGQVANDAPIIVDRANALTRAGLGVPELIGAAAVTVLAPLAGLLIGTRIGRDQRFAGLPPGALPPRMMAGGPAALNAGGAFQTEVVTDTLTKDQIPVAFAPPNIPVGEAGMLVDSKIDTTETAATLIDLAVRGAVRIDNDGEDQTAVLLDPTPATAPHEQALLSGMFGNQPGASVRLTRAPVGDRRMHNAHEAMMSALRRQVAARGWYRDMPSKGLFGLGCAGLIVVGVFVVLFGTRGDSGLAMLVFAIPAIAVAYAVFHLADKKSKGSRTAAGRAIADQIQGFQLYLSTAEADQLRFEEGEDVFSKYLPWAIIFDLAERWQRLCAQLVADGRLPDRQPYWYSGPNIYTGFAIGSLSSNVGEAFAPPPSPSGGGGGGTSSGFSGGFSGGGGGGGGGGSW